MSGYIQANTNGRLHDATEPSLSPLNRGFLYGDSVYEVWRTYHDVIFAWREHEARLARSASAVGFALPWSASALLVQIKRTVQAYRTQTDLKGDLYIRLQAYRGEGPIGLSPELAEKPGYIILVQPVPAITRAAWERGLNLTMVRNLRRNSPACLDPAWKTGNYLNNLMGAQEGVGRGADDVAFLNLAGELTEASTGNIGFVQGDRFITPPTSCGILPGITRAALLDSVAVTAGLNPREQVVHAADFGKMDECLLFSSTRDVQPVGNIDEVQFRVGPGSQTRRLKAAFQTYADTYAAEHPELCV